MEDDSATAKKKYLRESKLFDERVGCQDFFDLREKIDAAGIEFYSALGAFSQIQLSQIKQFCLDYPEYHIMSFTKGVYYNKVVTDPTRNVMYYLCNGDPDPSLSYELPDVFYQGFQSDLEKLFAILEK